MKIPTILAEAQSDLSKNLDCQLAQKEAGSSQLVFGVGNYQADLMLVGEAPGAKEDQSGQPFVGRAGQVLDEALNLIGLDRDDIFITNLVKWRPRNNADPSKYDRSVCQSLLETELRVIQPKLVVGLGRLSSLFFKEDLNLAKDNGLPIKVDLNGMKLSFIPCYHPAACLYRPHLKTNFKKLLNKLNILSKQMTENKNNSSPKSINNQMRNRARYSQRRTKTLINQIIDQANLSDDHKEAKAKKKSFFKDQDNLRIICLGGQDGIGSKNMVLFEYKNEAIIVDCGMDLSVTLPGANYTVCDVTYLEKIKTKLKAYIITHGHLDHIGGLPHIISQFPAPIYGSLYTIGITKKTLLNQSQSAHIVGRLVFHEMNMDNHQMLAVGQHFRVELIRVTHSIPESSAVSIETPVGRIIHTGDLRLDPEPLDKKPTDKQRLKELGKKGVVLLLSESTNSQIPGRTPTEDTLQASFDDILAKTKGRIFIGSISSNINRVQMIINSAARYNRRVAFDGRAMIQHVELSVKLGLLKIPQNIVISTANLASVPDNQCLMMCTGWQGEIGASLQRMSLNNHKHINLRPGDTVVISSKPVPGNEIEFQRLSINLVSLGCKVYKATTWEADGACGPLHVSGHGCRDEQRELIEMIQPKYLMPIYAGDDHRLYHSEIATGQTYLTKDRVLLVDNGDVVSVNPKKAIKIHRQGVVSGSVLIDDNGRVIPSVVVKDRLMLTENGLVVVILTISKKTGKLLCSPDIVTRGFIHIKENEHLMMRLRDELKRAVSQRFKRVPLDNFKMELKDHVNHFLFSQTQNSPVIIPVINLLPATAKAHQCQDATDRQKLQEKIVKQGRATRKVRTAKAVKPALRGIKAAQSPRKAKQPPTIKTAKELPKKQKNVL